MLTRATVFVLVGTICLVVSAWLLYRMVPTERRPKPLWMRSEAGETAAALSQFILMILGASFLMKGML